MSYDAVTAALAELCAAHPEVIDREPPRPQGPTVWSEAPPTDKVELHERLTNEFPSTVAALVACEAAATSNWDDERQWDVLAGAVSAVVQDWPEMGLELVGAVGAGHALIAQAVIRGWTMSHPDTELAPRILDRTATMELEPIVGWVTAMVGGFAVSGSTPVEWFTYIQSEELAKKCWELIDPTTPSTLQGANDHTMTALNHPAGHLAEYWVERVGHLWRTSGESWRGIPQEIAEYIAHSISEENPRSEAAAVRFCRYLAFFHQADPDWCKQYLFPLFNWEDSPRASAAWSGFLSAGQWTNKLLADEFLGMLVSTVCHRDQLDKPGQRNLPALLARLTVAADVDPLLWLKDFVTDSSVSDRVDWAQAIRHQLSSLDADSVEQQWGRWMHTYLSDRVSSVPRRLDPQEASAMASWPLFLTESIVSGIDLMLGTENAGLQLHNLFLHDLGEEQIAQAPEKVAQLLLHMLRKTDGQFYRADSVERAHAQLNSAGVNADILRQIEEEATRLGFTIQ
ncbi:DUF4020 domain-containing protein [Mycolicibacterium obuense]|nr:DUF4020 domain-containing protein [Mycolicibacterium obuense]